MDYIFGKTKTPVVETRKPLTIFVDCFENISSDFQNGYLNHLQNKPNLHNLYVLELI